MTLRTCLDTSVLVAILTEDVLTQRAEELLP
jgi:hypothetical protein